MKQTLLPPRKRDLLWPALLGFALVAWSAWLAAVLLFMTGDLPLVVAIRG